MEMRGRAECDIITFVFMSRLSPYSANCLGRRVTSYTTRGAKEIAKLPAMVP